MSFCAWAPSLPNAGSPVCLIEESGERPVLLRNRLSWRRASPLKAIADASLKMSRTAKFALLLTSSITGLTVWGVHYLQTSEREAMYQGVLRDKERIKARLAQMARETEFDEQSRRRDYLENLQPITNHSGPRPEKPKETLSSNGSINPIKLEGCKTC
ncbi:hypothetical protein O181_064645 [Austropuccinia psidii MF-1]|uniref:Cytochrome c oxidase assembly protein n=1 Tax=Austropuccinia psidii MF-1 TaxID=1389203 RepID=A0A9Q3ETJ5_9BASI|nr:hypothetical protein [Austropuccinia psidii MF-1]